MEWCQDVMVDEMKTLNVFTGCRLPVPIFLRKRCFQKSETICCFLGVGYIKLCQNRKANPLKKIGRGFTKFIQNLKWSKMLKLLAPLFPMGPYLVHLAEIETLIVHAHSLAILRGKRDSKM